MNEKNDKDQNAMHSLFLAISKMMPEEMIIERLEEALSDYKKNNNDDTRSTLKMNVIMYAMRLMTEKDSITETLKEFEEIDRMGKRDKILNT